MYFSIPEIVEQVICRLREAGGEVYLVGGCIRDQLLQREVHDYDLLTDLSIEDIVRIFPDSFSFRSHQTTVVLKERAFRIEISSLQGSSLLADLKQRDLTINALAWNPVSQEFFDPLQGRADLASGLIRSYDWQRAVRNDPLRMLRAIRLQAVLGFTLAPDILKVIEKNKASIASAAVERIREELYNILLSPGVKQAFGHLLNTGLLIYFLPELAACHDLEQNEFHLYDVFWHTIITTENIPPKKELRLAALLHDLGKALTVSTDEEGKRHFYGHAQASVKLALDIRLRLKLYDLDFTRVIALIENHMYCYVPGVTTDKALRRLLKRLGRDGTDDFTALRKADIIGTGRYTADDLEREEELHSRLKSLAEEAIPLAEKELDWSREDRKNFLRESGISGKEFAEVKRLLLEWLLDYPHLNQRENIIKQAAYFTKLLIK